MQKADGDRFLEDDPLLESSYFTSAGRHLSFRSQLRAAIPNRDLNALSNLAFILVKPDAIVSGKLFSVLEYLRNHGIAILHLGFLDNPQLRQFEDLYKFNLTLANDRNQIGSWWLNSQTYLLAPSVSLIVSAVTADVPRGTLHQFLNHIKGPSSPITGHKGQLRYDLEGTNRTVNLIHVSDDPYSSAREFLIFHSVDNLKSVLDTASRARREAAYLQSLQRSMFEFARSISSSMGTVEDLDFLRTIARVQIRLLARVASHVHPVSPAYHAILSMLNACAALCCRRAYDHACFRMSVDSLRSRYPSDSDGTDVAPLFEVLELLAKLESLDQTSVETIISKLESASVPISRWDKLVMISTLHYPDDYQRLVSNLRNQS